MPNQCVDIVVGLQYGSEGKGRLVERIAKNYAIHVRTGAPNAGHKVWTPDRSQQHAFQTIPCGAMEATTSELVIGRAAMIIESQLSKEIDWLTEANTPVEDRLWIDHYAMIIEQKHINAEHAKGDKDQDMSDRIGSTREGCGAALSDKVWRRQDLKFAKDCDWLEPYLIDTEAFLNQAVDDNKPILLEGTQGMGLSLHHTQWWPFCTSRDTNASNWLMEAGLSPRVARNVFGVARTFPIRVGGNSGPTGGKELTWKQITKMSGSPESLSEKTTVTKKIRRIFTWSIEDMDKAMAINRPQAICLNFVDYIDWANYSIQEWDALTIEVQSFIEDIEARYPECVVGWVGTGPFYDHFIDRGIFNG